jgi:hypothetical protein
MARTQTALLTATLAILAALGGCSSRTNVAASGNTPPLYTHVFVTAQEVWFNASATAGPDDGGWMKFPLTTPVTVDLVADTNGNFANVFTDLKLVPGSYSQVRFIPVDASTPLTVSAQTLGAAHNMEVDYVDGSGNSQQLPLELLNPDKGLGVQASLNVPIGNIGAALGGTGTTPATSSPFGATTTGTTVAATNTTTGTTSSSTTTAEFALIFDAARDLTTFTYGGANGSGGAPGALLSSHATAYDLSRSGGIQGQLTLTNLTLTSANGTPGITVSAESLSADGTRHFVVASTPVASDGSFTLYPLVADANNNTSYDIVIHGAGIATIIIRNIVIPPYGNSSGLTTSSTNTSTTTSTTGSTNPDTSPITPSNLVSVGTLIPRSASYYTTNVVTAAGAPLPAGAEVAFYETLAGSGNVPYVIEAAPIDPFNQVLGNPQTLSAGTVDSGTYVSSAATITVVSAAPAEGPGNYQVAGTAPLYADGTLGALLSAPAASSASGSTPPAATSPTVGALTLASGITASTVSASVRPASATEYDQGEVMLSQSGRLIASAPIGAALTAGGGTVQLTGVPGGTATSIYYVTVRAWKSSDPAGTLSRQWFSTPVDLRSGSTASVQLDLN